MQTNEIPFGLPDTALRWKPSEGKAPQSYWDSIILPLRTSASHPHPWDEQISSQYWSLLAQACLAESQGSSG